MERRGLASAADYCGTEDCGNISRIPRTNGGESKFGFKTISGECISRYGEAKKRREKRRKKRDKNKTKKRVPCSACCSGGTLAFRKAAGGLGGFSHIYVLHALQHTFHILCCMHRAPCIILHAPCAVSRELPYGHQPSPPSG